jgi:DNA-binding transcriptional regulator YiaG
MSPQTIKGLRQSLGLTQQQFAERLGLATKGAVSLLESGDREPTGPLVKLLEMLAADAGKKLPKKRAKSPD